MPDISVIICTHNPRPDYLARTLDSLKVQTLAKEQWELLLIDNASRELLATQWDLSWHFQGRHICEEELGLTPARLRGIKESRSDLLVFIDDDNVIDRSYLQNALTIHREFKQLGTFGAGQIKGEFESSPLEDTIPFLGMLALRDEKSPKWSNMLTWNSTIPFGAGQCVLRSVASEYAEILKTNKVRRTLGRRGEKLLSCEDIDMALFACKSGLGTGVFPELSLTHLIPSRRLAPQYLVSLAEGNATSHLILARLWDYQTKWNENPVLAWYRHWKRLFKSKGLAREIYQAERRGRKTAALLLAEIAES